MMKPRISLFAEQEREDRRAKLGDPLVGLAEHVDFEALAARIDAAASRPSRAKGGRPPYPTVLMIKILEYQLLDRRSFLHFLDLTESSSIPDAKTIWLFSDRLAQAGVGNQVFEQVQQQLLLQGYLARGGQIVDASPVQAPVQRNKREEAETVKEGTMPLGWKPRKRAQKDVDAKWTRKHGKNYFGYKLHASVDKRCKLIRKIAITHAAVADTIVFEELLELSNMSRHVYADRGYPSIEREASLKKAGWRVHIERRGHATKGIPRRRNGATVRSLHRALLSSMCLAPWPRWAANCCAVWESCARRSSCNTEGCQLQPQATRLFEGTRPGAALKSSSAACGCQTCLARGARCYKNHLAEAMLEC